MVTDAGFTLRLPLDMCVADSESGIGYIIGTSLGSELGPRRAARPRRLPHDADGGGSE
jgi:carbamate kinase